MVVVGNYRKAKVRRVLCATPRVVWASFLQTLTYGQRVVVVLGTDETSYAAHSFAFVVEHVELPAVLIGGEIDLG